MTAWLRALTAATKAGLIPGTPHDHFVLRCGEELAQALQTAEYGRPLALGAAVQDAVRRKELIQLGEFLDARGSVYASSWIPTAWQVLSWGLRALGVLGDGAERVERAEFVVLGLLEVSCLSCGSGWVWDGMC